MMCEQKPREQGMAEQQQADFAASSPAADWPSKARSWSLVLILVLAYICAFADRQILSLLVDPIKRDLNITDTEFSLLNGLAFTLCYTIVGLPLAWLADRGSRRNLIISCISFWSVMTALCGMANSYWTLFLARMGVGAGEAGLSPAAYSMIADHFPPEKRARPMSVYATGSILGAGIAFMVGGAVVQWTSDAHHIVLPLVGAIKSWQVAFLSVAMIGPPVVLAMVLIREPSRREMGVAQDGGGTALVGYMRRRGRVFLLLTFAYGISGMVIASYKAWAPAVLMRQFGWEVGTVGFVLGAMLMLGSGIGVLLGGWLSDRLAKGGRLDAPPMASLVAACIAGPFAVAAPLVDSSQAVTILLGAATFGFGLMQGLPAPALQAIAPNRLRARIFATYFLIGNPIAFIVGPTAVAMVSDGIFHDPAKVGLALAWVSGIAMPISALCLVAALAPFRRAVTEEVHAKMPA